MTIRFYPSRLPGEPLETHEHGVTSIRSWLVANVEGYEDRDVPPLTVEVEGQSIPPGEWATFVIHPDSDVRLYPVPFGLEAATIAWIGVGIAVLRRCRDVLVTLAQIMDVRTNGDLQRLNDHLRPAAGVEAVEYCHDFYPIKKATRR